jgi:hypothetical protein
LYLHAFYPFIEYEKHWTKFSDKGEKGKEKTRLIRYAARRDSCIFSHYRSLLEEKYESKLRHAGISDCVLGYRRIPSKPTSGNKCNIHFAQDAFEKVRHAGNCYVYALDISKFFDNLDHAFLKTAWAKLLGSELLPEDHFQVYKAITTFSSLNRLAVYESLGFIGKPGAPSKKPKAYLVKHGDIPIQLCSPSVFRNKLAPLIKVNNSSCGIPQGAAISDVLSNLYLFDFDMALYTWASGKGGSYFRYSDDILVVIPGLTDRWDDCFEFVRSQIRQSGNRLEIHPDKCSAYRFTVETNPGVTRQICKLIHEKGCNNGVEYLGFRYDGLNIYLRESTRAKLNRAIVRACRRAARFHVQQNPGYSLSDLIQTVPIDRVLQRVGRVRDFEDSDLPYKKWTFWTYARRCAAVLGPDGRKIYRQLAGYRSFVRRKLESEIQSALLHLQSP